MQNIPVAVETAKIRSPIIPVIERIKIIRKINTAVDIFV